MSLLTQTRFATALVNAGMPVPTGVTAATGDPPAKRFAVYRNNVVVSLVAALRTRFPAVERIVGADFFAATARVFATEHPPTSPVMMWYGDAFPGFLERFPPAAELPYLADVARLEAARTRAYHAADAAALDPARLATLGDALGSLRITLHPSAEIIGSRQPIVTIWGMNTDAIALAPITDWRGEDALVMRPGLDVEVRALPPGGAIFLLWLQTGQPLAAAAAAASRDADFDLTLNLAGLFGSGLAIDVVASA
jgi:hypothetical protein